MMDEQLPVELIKSSYTVIEKPKSERSSVTFKCSFGGEIVLRPHENQLQYEGGYTRILAVGRGITFSGLLNRVSEVSGINDVIIKYKLPNDDLDALVCVINDEDVENMIEEYDSLVQGSSPISCLRLYLFGDTGSRKDRIRKASDANFLCSFGGLIFPRPHDNKLRYVGGDTRILVVPRGATYSSLLDKVSKMYSNADIRLINYQLPDKDLDSLISVYNDEDVEIMMDEYDELVEGSDSVSYPTLPRFRLFVFATGNSQTKKV